MQKTNKLATLMKEKGLTNVGLAEAVGVSEGTIRQAKSLGAARLGADTIYEVAKVLDTTIEALIEMDSLQPDQGDSSQPVLAIRCKTGAGVWVESFDHVDEPIGEIEAAPIYAYRRCHQWFEQLEGDSMNRIYPDGCYLHVVDAFDLAYQPRHDDVVIVERSRDGGFLRQRTAKQIEITQGGGVKLWPRSTNPRWQEPIELNETPDDETVTVRIVGLVVRGIIDPRGL